MPLKNIEAISILKLPWIRYAMNAPMFMLIQTANLLMVVSILFPYSMLFNVVLITISLGSCGLLELTRTLFSLKDGYHFITIVELESMSHDVDNRLNR